MNNELQSIARHYLSLLKDIAIKFGLKEWLDNLIEENKRGDCSATVDECRMLTRLCDDERVTRQDVPKLLNTSYRHCVDNNVFERLKTLKRVGIYDKISVLLFKKRQK